MVRSNFGLMINLNKIEILPIGRIGNVEALALELGCKGWVAHHNLVVV